MDDGNRRIAKALYDRANQSEKTKVKEFFKKLSPTATDQISLQGEINRGVVSNQIVLEELDSNSDGFLDFNDVLLLFYYDVKKAITILRCPGCSKLIFGTSYSCFECLFDVNSRFTLCLDCYVKGSVEHPHRLRTSTATDTEADLRDQAILLKFNDLIVHAHKTSPPKDLKILWEKAKKQVGYHASPALETMADNYFKSMRSDNHLDLEKFSDLTKKAFLTPRPDSHPATNQMKEALAKKLGYNGPQTTPTEIHEAHSYTASPSTLQTHSGNSSTHPPNLNTSSNGISPLEVATTTFKIVEMALAIASLSSLCTIM